MDGWKNKWLDGQTSGWKDGWIDLFDGQIDGWTDGWMSVKRSATLSLLVLPDRLH